MFSRGAGEGECQQMSLAIKGEEITLAFTGASGAVYGLRLLEILLAAQQKVSIVVSKAAQIVIATEMEEAWPAQPASTQALSS